jgi:hypothetical protein
MEAQPEVAVIGSPLWNSFTSTGRVVLLAREVRLGLWKRSYSTKARYFCELVLGFKSLCASASPRGSRTPNWLD